MPQITTARLRLLDQRWRSTINKYRGAAPVGLAIAHMVAESNGITNPTIRDTKHSTGIMRIPFRVGKTYGYTTEELEDPVKNIYCWGLLTNANSQRLIRQFNKSWTKPNYDFWLSVRLIFIIGFTSYEKLFAKVYTTTGAITTATDTTTVGLLDWIRNSMTSTQRFGTFNRRDLRRIADELDNFTKAMNLLDGLNRIGDSFTMAPTVTPGGIDAARTARVRSAS
jgi:hypothetical protein